MHESSLEDPGVVQTLEEVGQHVEGGRDAEGTEIPLQSRGWRGAPLGRDKAVKGGEAAGNGLLCWFQSDAQPSPRAPVTGDPLPVPSTPRPRLSPPGTKLPGSTLQGRPRPLGRGTRIQGTWPHSVYHPQLCTDLSSGFPGWCAGLGASITPILPVTGRE